MPDLVELGPVINRERVHTLGHKAAIPEAPIDAYTRRLGLTTDYVLATALLAPANCSPLAGAHIKDCSLQAVGNLPAMLNLVGQLDKLTERSLLPDYPYSRIKLDLSLGVVGKTGAKALSTHVLGDIVYDASFTESGAVDEHDFFFEAAMKRRGRMAVTNRVVHNSLVEAFEIAELDFEATAEHYEALVAQAATI